MTAETIHLAHGPTPVLWRRSARARRVGLRIDTRAAAVVITLPPRAGRAAGLRLLDEHAAWVAGKLSALPAALAFVDGGTLTVEGTPYRIRHTPGARGGAWLEGAAVIVAGEAAFLPRRVEDLLRREAGQRLGALVAHTADEMGCRPARVAIRDTRSRWGSCSARATVMLNWRLVMAPREVQHYVVVHELAHLRHMNHGAGFWDLVRQFAPGTDRYVAWLKRHGPALMRVGAGVEPAAGP